MGKKGEGSVWFELLEGQGRLRKERRSRGGEQGGRERGRNIYEKQFAGIYTYIIFE